jgi:hypothetical protein
MTDDELIAAFEAATLPAAAFRHPEHVRAAWWYVRRYPLHEAIGRFGSALRRFATTHGVPGLYHETITVAFMLIVADRLDDEARALPWEEFSVRHADLLAWKPSVLDRYYTEATLWSDRARRQFVMPDRID